MPQVWAALLIRLLIAVLAGLTFGWIFDAAAGLAVVALALLALLAAHTVRLVRLLRWLKAPAEREIPDAGGAWGKVFADLHRLLREERKARARLEADLEVFSQAAEASPDGLVFLDAEDRIAWCNRVAEQHLGLHGERDAGLPVINLVRLPGFADFLAGAQTGKPLTCRPQDKRGRVYSIEAIRFGADRKLLISTDVSHIERAETMRRDFVANVSHELRTPLTVISGYLEHMHDDPNPDPAEWKQQMDMVNEQAGRMLRLVDDLLTLSRLEDEAQPPAEETFDVRDLIYDVSAEGRRLSGGRHSITCEVLPSLLKGSREELRSAFANLVSNAVRYTPAGGRIVLHWAMRDGKGVFSVEDSGIGIPEEHIPRLAERFYRVDRGRSRESGGTGLGLAIVKHILLRHQAALEIASAAGIGSTFGAAFPEWRVRPLSEHRA
ncbi:MAG: phosphate regulon sensor histidine kinase PhoR [Rhodocyclaceae bacterium]|nr:phosphate regulon sensor histidine kinase PhoR [Rhodocyclaceae bacterium]